MTETMYLGKLRIWNHPFLLSFIWLFILFTFLLPWRREQTWEQGDLVFSIFRKYRRYAGSCLLPSVPLVSAMSSRGDRSSSPPGVYLLPGCGGLTVASYGCGAAGLPSGCPYPPICRRAREGPLSNPSRRVPSRPSTSYDVNFRDIYPHVTWQEQLFLQAKETRFAG